LFEKKSVKLLLMTSIYRQLPPFHLLFCVLKEMFTWSLRFAERLVSSALLFPL